nr:tetratricopeptide repeat protein [Bacteroidota bacterium]
MNTNYFRCLFLCFFCICISVLKAQQNKIDSLQKILLTAKEDTTKVNTLNALAMELRRDNTDTAIYFARKALTLSEKINFKPGTAEAYLWWGTALYNSGRFDESLNPYIKAKMLLEVVLSTSKTGTKKTKKLLAHTLNNLGSLYRTQGNLSQSLKNGLLALKIRKEIEDKKGMGDSYSNIGNIYFDQGNYPEALNNYFASLKIQEAIKNKLGESNAYANIGSIYYNQGDNTKALKFYFKSLKLRKEIGAKSGIALAYSNVGITYSQLGNFSEGLKNDFAALEIHKEIKDKNGEAVCYGDIGDVYLILGNYSEALKYCFAAVKIHEGTGNKFAIAAVYQTIAIIYQKQGDLSKAEDYAKRAMATGSEVGYIILTRDASLSLFEIYKQEGKFKDALKMHELFVQSRDSITNEKNQKETLSQQFKYDYAKKTLADSLNFMNQKNISDLKNEAERKGELTKRYTLYAGLGLVFIFSLFIFNRFRVTSNQKKIIEHQNSQIVESINYSKQIQEAVLPSEKNFRAFFPDSFILYKPKAIVSGDFYWVGEKNNKIIFAVVDCTGHGVPGAFMS